MNRNNIQHLLQFYFIYARTLIQARNNMYIIPVKISNKFGWIIVQFEFKSDIQVIVEGNTDPVGTVLNMYVTLRTY